MMGTNAARTNHARMGRPTHVCVCVRARVRLSVRRGHVLRVMRLCDWVKVRRARGGEGGGVRGHGRGGA